MGTDDIGKGVGTGAVEVQHVEEILPLGRLAARIERPVRGPGVGPDSDNSSIGTADPDQIVIGEAGIVNAQVGPALR